jgi:two-component system, NarL family, response regulator
VNSQARILLVDDHPSICIGLTSVITEDARLSICGTAETVAQAVAMYRYLRPDVVLMDLRLPDGSGTDAMSEMRKGSADVKVLVMSAFSSEVEIHAAMTAGVRGYILKTIGAGDLRAAIHAVIRGERYLDHSVAARLPGSRLASGLTERERDVLQLIARGKRNREIAEVLGIVEGTVKSHVVKILSKLGVRHRTAAVTVAIERKIIRFD